jgi:hypothetical protein
MVASNKFFHITSFIQTVFTAAPDHRSTDDTWLSSFLHQHDISRTDLLAGSTPFAVFQVHFPDPMLRIECNDSFGTKEITIVTIIAGPAGKAPQRRNSGLIRSEPEIDL